VSALCLGVTGGISRGPFAHPTSPVGVFFFFTTPYLLLTFWHASCFALISIRNSCGVMSVAGCHPGNGVNPTVACLDETKRCAGSNSPNNYLHGQSINRRSRWIRRFFVFRNSCCEPERNPLHPSNSQRSKPPVKNAMPLRSGNPLKSASRTHAP
jgi:hypothetical protein